MRTYRCPCSREKEVEDQIIIVGCPECQKSMKEVKDVRQRKNS